MRKIVLHDDTIDSLAAAWIFSKDLRNNFEIYSKNDDDVSFKDAIVFCIKFNPWLKLVKEAQSVFVITDYEEKEMIQKVFDFSNDVPLVNTFVRLRIKGDSNCMRAWNFLESNLASVSIPNIICYIDCFCRNKLKRTNIIRAIEAYPRTLEGITSCFNRSLDELISEGMAIERFEKN